MGSDLTASHEDRLQRVESGVSTANVALAELRTEFKHVSDGMQRIESKVDALQHLKAKLTVLDDDYKNRKARLRVARRASIGAIVSALGIVITRFSVYMWQRLWGH